MCVGPRPPGNASSSLFHISHDVLSRSVKTDASIDPCRSSWHWTGPELSGSNGPAGLEANAYAMHCRPLAVSHTVGYRTPRLPKPWTSGAHVRPGCAHNGMRGMASPTSVQSRMLGDVHIWTLRFWAG